MNKSQQVLAVRAPWYSPTSGDRAVHPLYFVVRGYSRREYVFDPNAYGSVWLVKS